MKIKSLLFLMVVSLIAFTSCKKDDPKPDLAGEVAGMYKGAFQKSTYQVNGYKVTITKLENDKVKIEPEDSEGTAFELSINEIAGKYVGSTDNVTISFSKANEIWNLSYVYNGEQFSGVKQ